MSAEKRTLAVLAGIIGAVAGLLAGLIGEDVGTGVFTGALTSIVVAVIFPAPPRDFDSPRVNVSALSPAGWVAGIISSVVCEAGWLGAFICSGLGWVMGLFLPPLIIAIFINSERSD